MCVCILLLEQALQPLLRDSPVKVQKYVLRQFAQLLPHDVEARRAFVQSGGLQFLQVGYTHLSPIGHWQGRQSQFHGPLYSVSPSCGRATDVRFVCVLVTGAERDGGREADGVHHADQQLLPPRGGGVLQPLLLQDAARQDRRIRGAHTSTLTRLSKP